jgi:predicted nucleic acid-binding protein
MPAKLFVDTNVLVYIANESAELHHQMVEKFTRIADMYDLIISRQIIREYAVVMTRPGIVENPLTPAEVSDDIEKNGA